MRDDTDSPRAIGSASARPVGRSSRAVARGVARVRTRSLERSFSIRVGARVIGIIFFSRPRAVPRARASAE